MINMSNVKTGFAAGFTYDGIGFTVPGAFTYGDRDVAKNAAAAWKSARWWLDKPITGIGEMPVVAEVQYVVEDGAVSEFSIMPGAVVATAEDAGIAFTVASRRQAEPVDKPKPRRSRAKAKPDQDDAAEPVDKPKPRRSRAKAKPEEQETASTTTTDDKPKRSRRKPKPDAPVDKPKPRRSRAKVKPEVEPEPVTTTDAEVPVAVDEDALSS